MIRNVFKIAFKIMILLVVTSVLVVYLSPIFRKDESSSASQLRKLPENSVDILVLGSSHAQYSINPGVIYHDTGYYSFVMGSGCQPMVMSYYNLVEALKTQKPEVVLLDVFTMLPAQAICYADGMFYVAASQMSGDTRVEAVKNIDNAEKISEYLYDLGITHDRWKEDGFFKESGLDRMMGYVSQQPNDFVFHHLVQLEPSGAKVELKEKDVKALNDIIELCERNDIELILMKAAFDADQKNIDALHAVWDIADEKEIRVLDFIALAEDIGFTLGMDGDTWHNNTWGARKTSKYVAQYMMENELILSHQTMNELDCLYQQLDDLTAMWVFQNNIDIYQLMELAKEYDVSMIVKYTGTEGYSSIGEYESTTLQQLGAGFNFIEQKHEDYYALIQHGKVVKDGNTPFEIEVNGNQVSVSSENIQVNDKMFTELGELEIIFCSNDFSWFHEMPIDYASRYFWRNECDSWACSFFPRNE